MLTKIMKSPEIWKIEIPLADNPLKNVNSYVIRSGRNALILDTAFNYEQCRNVMNSALAELDLNYKLTELFLTHLHADHIGLVDDFVERGCNIYMNTIDYQYFCKIKCGNLWPELQNTFMQEGFPENELKYQETANHGRIYDPLSIFPATLITDGDKIALGEIEAVCIHTPGHTPGHTMLYLPEQQILFTGDHILFDISPNINIWPGIESSLKSYLESLAMVKNIPVRLTLPGHRNYIGNLAERVDKLIEHHEERLNEILSVVKRDGDQSGYVIASKISWSARNLPWEQFPPNQKWFATGETLSHLYKLVEQGVISRIEIDGKYFYRAV